MEGKFKKRIFGTSICEEIQKESWWGRDMQTRTVFKSLQKCKQFFSLPAFRNTKNIINISLQKCKEVLSGIVK